LNWRATAFAGALFAITLNLVQPLVHAALLRDGAPSALWTAFCNSVAATSDDNSRQVPSAAARHECCLGLAHAQAIAGPPQAYVATEPAVRIIRFIVRTDALSSFQRRDRPNQPRAPPPNS